MALATHWTHVLGVRFFDRVGKGIRTAPRDALIAGSVSEKERGKSFGIHRAMDTAGAVVGTLIAFFILQKFFSFRLIFWLSFIPGGIAVMILIFGVRDVKGESKKRISFDFKSYSPTLKKFLLVMVFFSLANFSYAFFLLRANELGTAIAIIPLLYLVYNIMYAVFSVPFGKLSDAIGRKSVLASGFMLFGATALGFAFMANPFSIWILFALYGLFMAVTDGVSRAYVSDLAKKESMGAALGSYHMIIGLVVFPSNLIGGLLWQNINVQAPFIFAAVLSVCAGVMIIVMKE